MTSIETALVLLRQLHDRSDEVARGDIGAIVKVLHVAESEHAGFMDLARRLAASRCNCIKNDAKVRTALDAIIDDAED